MKELIYANFQLTRATGVPIILVIDGVSIEMLRRGASPLPAEAKPKKAKPEKPHRPANTGSKMKPKAAGANKTQAARPAGAPPQ